MPSFDTVRSQIHASATRRARAEAPVLAFSSLRVLRAEHDKPLSHTIPDLASGEARSRLLVARSILSFGRSDSPSSYPRGPFTAPPSLSHRRTRHVIGISFWAQSTDIRRRVCIRIAPTRSVRARIQRAQTLPTLTWEGLVPIPAAPVCVPAFHFRKTRPRRDLGTAGTAARFAPSQTHLFAPNSQRPIMPPSFANFVIHGASLSWHHSLAPTLTGSMMYNGSRNLREALFASQSS
ncbi:hypothetical protein HETIRDRAFT_99475 [Heterobasidion irregulare TC 32-1]|uniref:Uncharacterized protein n=1 Tax=Heterobasidion irregulare (strain TC 32-1) TaxID=747525 RepID=W4KMK9_HETIT|nr:uncharacterized protein HETIRDRAFT_99475 [Heterobasidion irregulare TC 32-1]ETW87078.1 hypothetical protein HETIRDRAFT_99475 [Heterobasidion irregulare TC 32-1]